MLNKKVVTIAIILVGIVGVLLYLVNNYSIVRVSVNPNTTVTTLLSNDEGLAQTKKASKSGDIFIVHRGEYGLTYSRSDFEDANKGIDINSLFINIVDVPMNYTEEKLAQQLTKEAFILHSLVDSLITKTASDQSLISGDITGYNLADKGYIIHEERLFGTGEWYGVSVKPADLINNDTFKLIFHKEKNKWSIATPPRVVIYGKDFPKIPQAVVSVVNNQM